MVPAAVDVHQVPPVLGPVQGAADALGLQTDAGAHGGVDLGEGAAVADALAQQGIGGCRGEFQPVVVIALGQEGVELGEFGPVLGLTADIERGGAEHRLDLLAHGAQLVPVRGVEEQDLHHRVSPQFG